MAFLKYSDIPVYANFTTEEMLMDNFAPFMFAASQVSINFNPNLSANRYLGKAQIRNDFSVTGPLEAKISMTFFPLIETSKAVPILNVQKENQVRFFETSGNFDNGHEIIISNFAFARSYLQNYSVKINAFQPISVTANFISYDLQYVANNTLSRSFYYETLTKTPNSPYYEGLHGLTTKMDGSVNNIPSTKTSIDINVDCQRTPIYALGSKTPSSVVLTSVERTTTVNGENIGAVVDISGSNPGATNIYMLPLSSTDTPSANNSVLTFDINGRITSQDLSVSQQGILNGKVVIKEIIL